MNLKADQECINEIIDRKSIFPAYHMNSQQLADYLQVDRSALSAELSKMKADGLIDYWKNHFKLLS